MKKLLLAMILILGLSVPCLADSTVQFTWQPNSESDLKEYRLYQTSVSGNYVLGVDIPVAIIPAGTETVSIMVEDGIKFWVLTAADNHENESGASNEVTATLDSTAPNAPSLNVIVTVTIIQE